MRTRSVAATIASTGDPLEEASDRRGRERSVQKEFEIFIGFGTTCWAGGGVGLTQTSAGAVTPGSQPDGAPART